ncbi:unnamed protein product, partial [Eretmochelys imbricata]
LLALGAGNKHVCGVLPGPRHLLLGNAVNWSQAFWIHGLQDGVYEASRDISEAKGVQLEESCYFTYLHLDPRSMPEI